MSNNEEPSVKYPGIPATTDGAGMVVWTETHITQGAFAYPITPSTTMGQGYQVEVANGGKNLWEEPLFFLELESEHSAASACEGFAAAGGRVTNFTSGQGLVLMTEVLYTISGKRLPVVFHIGARALTSHSLNVHCGHDDVMGVADTGWGMAFAKNAQDAGDLALLCRRVAEETETPFFNVQDGFLTTHTIESVRLPEPELMKEFVGAPTEKIKKAMDPQNPFMLGVVQNQDSYMKGKIAQRAYYEKVAEAWKKAAGEYARLTGRAYPMIETYRMEDAEVALVGMGSAMETAMATADWIREKRGVKVGVIHVTVYRPFPGKELVEALRNVKGIAVLEKMDNPLAQFNPLTAELKAAFADAAGLARLPRIISGVGGLGSRDIRPGDFISIVDSLVKPDGKKFFVVGIKHELALERSIDPDIRPAQSFSMRGHSVGGYGSVTTNKIIASIAADLFQMSVQAYPKYGSEKKGLPTTYYLTISKEHLRTHCELEKVEFVAVNDVNAFKHGNPLAGITNEGILFIQSDEKDPGKVWSGFPVTAQKIIREKKIRVYYLDTVDIARQVSHSQDLQQRMQGIVLLGAFLKITPFKNQQKISEEALFQGIEKSLLKYFGRRGASVIQDNLNAVRKGYAEVQEIPQEISVAGQAAAAYR